MGKIQYLDGLRGVAAAIVVIGHFIGAFYPAFPTMDTSLIHTRQGIEILLAHTPLSLITSGGFAVSTFFVLSAYVLSFRFFINGQEKDVIQGAYRRWFRLGIPVFMSILFAHIILQFNFYFNLDAGIISKSTWLQNNYQFQGDILKVLKDSTWNVFFNGGTLYNNALWTMEYEFKGSFLVFGFLGLFGKSPKRYLVYVALIFLFFCTYYIAFIFGLILSDIYNSEEGKELKKYFNKFKIVYFVLFVVGCWVGTYRQGRGILDYFLLLQINPLSLKIFYHTTGAAMIVFSLLNLEILKKIFSYSICTFLGRISFAMYILHIPIECSMASYVFIKMIDINFRYSSAVAIAFVVEIVLVGCLSYLMTKYIDEPAMKKIRVISNKFI